MAKRIHNERGAPIAGPIRKMLSRPRCDGVIFECDSPEYAKSVRSAALMLKKRERYDYKTKRNGSNLIVYKKDVDPWFMRGPVLLKLAAKACD